MRSSEPSRLDRLSRGNQRDAALNEAFVVLSIGASLIATLGLLANSADVVIGAMVVAPWIKPLRAGAFAVLLGDVPLLARALRTLLLGVGTTLVLAALLGTVAGLPQFGSEVMARTSPNLLNLGIALVAGALATYANLSRDAVSSLAGTAIAVALVPPVCVMGLLLAHQHWALATGAGLLFATNLLGVLTGGVVLMAWKDPLLRQQLRRSHLSVANFALTGLLLIPLGTSFLGLLRNARRESTRETVQLTTPDRDLRRGQGSGAGETGDRLGSKSAGHSCARPRDRSDTADLQTGIGGSGRNQPASALSLSTGGATHRSGCGGPRRSTQSQHGR
jgi:uncharacterized hydrophobic protein (TIGR00271 family)